MNNTNRSGYIPQLDALRAIAVILVIISHWLVGSYWLNKYTPNGILGVTLFFVLSGYLITGILLKSKEKLALGLKLKDAFIIFYIRRSLRIFPVYYLLILLLLWLHPNDILPSLGWHVFYASNFYFWIQNAFAAQLSHLWSLAVEEQFYLLWPAVILMTNRVKLPAVFIGGIISAMVFRAFMYNPPNHMGRLLMPGSLDSFSIGALLAYGQLYKTSWYEKLIKFKQAVLPLMFSLMIGVQIFLNLYPNDWLVLIFYFFFISLFFGLLIMVVSVNKSENKWMRLILENPAILYTGRISYGLYLFHLLIPNFNGLQLHPFLQDYRTGIIFLIRFSMIMGLASVSWYFFEKPILKFKNKFDTGLLTKTKKLI